MILHKLEELLRLLALLAKLLQLLNFLTLSNFQNPAKPRHRPFEQSLFLFYHSRVPFAFADLGPLFFRA